MKFSFAQKSLACILASSITIAAFAIVHTSKIATASPQPPADVLLDEVAISQVITDQIEEPEELQPIESDDEDAEAVAEASVEDMIDVDAAESDDGEQDDEMRGDEEPSDGDDDTATEEEPQEFDPDELQIQELVNDIRESTTDAKVSKREELRNKLKEVLLKRTARQQQRIEQMKRRLEMVEQQLQRRVELSDQIVERRLGELLEEQDELSWDHEPNVDPQDIDAEAAPVGETMPAPRKPGVGELPVIVQERASVLDALARGQVRDLLGASANDKARGLQSLEVAKVIAAQQQHLKAQAKELEIKRAEFDKARAASDLSLKALDSQLKLEADQKGQKSAANKRTQLERTQQMERLIELQTQVDELQAKLDAQRSERDIQRSPKKR